MCNIEILSFAYCTYLRLGPLHKYMKRDGEQNTLQSMHRKFMLNTLSTGQKKHKKRIYQFSSKYDC